jgi:hypothetical protein
MFSFSSSEVGDSFNVLIDVGSASVGVAVVVRVNSTSKIVWQKRLEYGYQSNEEFERFARTMYSALLEAGMKVTSEGFKAAKEMFPKFSVEHVRVYCVYASPWYLGAVRDSKKTQEKGFHVTDAVLEKMRDDGFTEFVSTPECEAWQSIMGTPFMLEAHTDEIRAGGYEVTLPIRGSVQELNTRTYYSLVSEVIQGHVEEVLSKVFPNQEIVYLSSMYLLSLTSLYGEKEELKKRVFLVEVTGEVTSVALLKKGKIISLKTAPFGTNHILKAAAPKALSAQETRSSLDTLFQKKQLTFNDFPESLQDVLKAWHESVTKILNTISGGVTPPQHTLLVVESVWQSLYSLVLGFPWEIPGVRKEAHVTVLQAEKCVLSGKDAQDASVPKDARLFVYTHLLYEYADKLGMCYTKN